MTLEEIKNDGFLSSPLDSGKTLFEISVNTDQIGTGFEADTREKESLATFIQRSGIKIIDEQPNFETEFFRCSTYKFLTRPFSESRILWVYCCHFFGVSASNPMPI